MNYIIVLAVFIMFAIVLLVVPIIIQSLDLSFQLKQRLNLIKSDIFGSPSIKNSAKLEMDKLKIYLECITSLQRMLALTILYSVIVVCILILSSIQRRSSVFKPNT